MKTNVYFHDEKNSFNKGLFESVEKYVNENNTSAYVVKSPLLDNKYSYDVKKSYLVLIPGHKLSFFNCGDDNNLFFNYVEDFIEDIGSISDKYRYKLKIGRPRSWRDNLINVSNDGRCPDVCYEVISSSLMDRASERKLCDLLISLVTGSINDIERVQLDVPDNILDKIKQKIILFDAQQTRFIYEDVDKKRVTIQGLSGTGKTELLLHKLKEIYIGNSNNKVAVTCHNRILADTLRTRIPEFFNFMKVEEQIEWGDRLLCANAWGSRGRAHTGVYSYITVKYGLDYFPYAKRTSFDFVCKTAIDQLKARSVSEYCFDYMLIDESQDFPDSFFDLCEMVTKEKIYVAGDIFQSIFDENIVPSIAPDFLLSKCYRTDPRTLMFAHAIGMGLFETPKIRWLAGDNEWEHCGYNVCRSNGKLELTRDPIVRFGEDVERDFDSVEIIKTKKDFSVGVCDRIIGIINDIRSSHPTVSPQDIAVIFIDDENSSYACADVLNFRVPSEVGWGVNIAYETKEKLPNHLFVSNKNNVKGLEFPFVICVTQKIKNSLSYRNALYMMISRSFITTYLLISDDGNEQFIGQIQEGLEEINKDKKLTVVPPTEEEMREISMRFRVAKRKPDLEEIVSSVFEDEELDMFYYDEILGLISVIFRNGYKKKSDVVRAITQNYELMIDGDR